MIADFSALVLPARSQAAAAQNPRQCLLHENSRNCTEDRTAYIAESAQHERKLWFEVLRLALFDLKGSPHRLPALKNDNERLREAARLQLDAREWILSTDIDVGSFHWICALFDLDAQAVRQRLLKVDPQKIHRLSDSGVKTSLQVKGTNGHERIVLDSENAAREKVIVIAGLEPLEIEQEERKPSGPLEQFSNRGYPVPRLFGRVGRGVGAAPQLAAPMCVVGDNPQATIEEEEMNKKQGIDWLRETLTQYETDLTRAEAETLRLKNLCSHLRAAVEVLDGKEYQKPISGISPTRKTAKSAAPNSPGGVPLKRNPDYANLPMATILKKLLDASPEPLSNDKLTRAIFDVPDKDFERAKGSVTSTLAQGAKKGLWRGLGGGLWTIDKQDT